MKRIPDEVCHFTKANTTFKILSTKKLRLGLIKNTNDPRETRERNFGVVYSNNSSFALLPNKEEFSTRINKEADRVGMEEWKVLCVSIHSPLRKSDHPLTTIYNQRIRPAYCNPAMWAHYGENHEGVCLIFNGATLNRKIYEEHGNNCFIDSGRVRYSLNLKLVAAPLIPITSELIDFQRLARAHYFSHRENIFLRKQPAWRYENEYRWLLYSPDKLPKFVSIESSIKAVIMGNNIPPTKEVSLIKMCKDLKIPCGKMEWKDGLAALNIDNIYWS